MKLLFYIFFSACVFVSCQGIPQTPEKQARVCTEICSGCGGPSFTENDVCFCYVEKGVDSKKCVDHAWKKSNLYGMAWEPIHSPGRIVRKARPVRGSFLDPIVANVFDKNSPGNLNNEILFAENFLKKSPIHQLFKRSIKKDLHDQEFEIYNFEDKNSERRKRVPRSLPTNKKSKKLNEIPENFPGEILFDDSKNLIREKRQLAAEFGAAVPKFLLSQMVPRIPGVTDQLISKIPGPNMDQVMPKVMDKFMSKFSRSNPGNMYEVVLQYPTKDSEEKVQLLFPDTQGLDISHELYYEDSDEFSNEDYDDDDDEDSTWNRMSSNYNPFQSLYTRQVYSADPYLRDSRSLYWGPDSQQATYFYPYQCSHYQQ